MVLIGIENYDKTQKTYPSLDGVKRDIYRMVQLWNDIYKYNSISTVYVPNSETIEDKTSKNTLEKLAKYKQYRNTPSKNTSSEIVANKESFDRYLVKIRSIIDLNEENDGLIFYFSGHGIKDKIILSDGKSYPIRSIIDHFDGEKCHHPKKNFEKYLTLLLNI